jgi:hemerythrin superfamily protein
MTSEGNFTTGARADAIEAVTTDHRVVEQLFTVLMHTKVPEDDELRSELARRIVHELSVHASIEEDVLYPAVRRHVDGGDDLIDRSVAEHQALKEQLARFDGMAPGNADFLQVAQGVEQLVAQHVQEEERSVLPALHDSVPGERLYELGDALEKAKASAPTHAHPNAPSNPVVSKIAGIVDKVRDAAKDVTDRH